jgi:hypothetical protein
MYTLRIAANTGERVSRGCEEAFEFFIEGMLPHT